MTMNTATNTRAASRGIPSTGAESAPIPELQILAPDGRWVPATELFGACSAPAIPAGSVQDLVAEAKRRHLTMESVLRAIRNSWN